MIRLFSTRQARLAVVATALVAASAAMAVPSSAAPRTESATSARHTAKPTIVLVHGAFADSSGFGEVIAKLTKDGYPVRTVANPLRGLPTDAAATKDVLRAIKGPIVLVGHSYGGAVITTAGAGEKNVKALVYLTALAPDKGEGIFGPTDAPIKHPLPPQPFIQTPTVAADGTVGADVILDPTQFYKLFAADVDPTTAATMAATQRPVSADVLTQKTLVEPAWRTIPTWYLEATQDRSNNPELQAFFAKRAHAHIKKVASSHAVYVSHPKATVDIIEDAARKTR